jgi:hypothetical protein
VRPKPLLGAEGLDPGVEVHRSVELPTLCSNDAENPSKSLTLDACAVERNCSNLIDSLAANAKPLG